MKNLMETIVASASAPVNQAIAIIRVSGSDAYFLVNKVFKKHSQQKKYSLLEQTGDSLVYGNIVDLNNNKIDEVVLVCYRAPRSFTGEDVIEINCHGGVLVTQKIIQLLITLGMRLAQRGEFTKRAFLNNKLNLIQAEAINDLIFAQNEHTLKTSINSLGKQTTNLINNLIEKLLTLIANIKVNIDYPEYDGVEDITNSVALKQVASFLEEIKTIKQHSKVSQNIKSGIDTVIIGKPNVGKSSLLNALLKEDKAIVSEIQGTTRDLVEGKINLGEISLNLIDTAGIRKATNKIEKIGINKTRQAVDKAQLVIMVLDGSKLLTKEDKELLALVKNKNYIIAINKSDLGLKLNVDGAVKISAMKHDINNLINEIDKRVIDSNIDFNKELILSNTRQLACLDKVESNIQKALDELKRLVTVDLAIIYLEEAYNDLLAVQGTTNEVDLIDEIFKRFCLGK